MFVKSLSGSEAPTGAILIVTGFEALSNRRTHYTVDQISIPAVIAGTTRLLINGLRPLETSGAFQYGDATPVERPGPLLVAYDTSDGEPAFGEMWGVRSGNWKLRKDEPGFEVLAIHPTIEGLVYVTFIPRPAYYAIANEDIEAPEDRESPTSAFATIQLNDPSFSNPNEFIDGPQIFVTNHWVDFSLAADKMLKVEWDWHYLHWSPYVSDCP